MKTLTPNQAISNGAAAQIWRIAAALATIGSAMFDAATDSETKAKALETYGKMKPKAQAPFKVKAKELHNAARKIVHGYRGDAKKEFTRKSNELRRYLVKDGKFSRSATIVFRAQKVRTPEGKAIVSKRGASAVQAEVNRVTAAINGHNRRTTVAA